MTAWTSPYIYLAERRVSERLKCHEVFRVDADATKKQVTSEYRRRASICHPDAGGDPGEFKQIRLAYEQALVLLKRNR